VLSELSAISTPQPSATSTLTAFSDSAAQLPLEEPASANTQNRAAPAQIDRFSHSAISVSVNANNFPTSASS
jgi:hypothetical protein